MTTRYSAFGWGLANGKSKSKSTELPTKVQHGNADLVRRKKRRITLGLAVGFALCVLFSLPLSAQNNADLAGTVRDSSGSVIPHADLKLTNEDTGVIRTAPADGTGIYSFPNIQPGIYDLSVSAAGFQPQKKTGITIHVADNVQINFDLQVGAASATVTVTAEQQSLETADAANGQVIDRQFMNNMPLINRSALDLAFLAPGVTQPPSSTYGNTSNTSAPYLTANNFVSDGSRNATSDVLIDGITTQETVTSGFNLFASYTPSVDAIQEFKVQQTNFSAEYGFSGATVTNLVTRSGTNQFHGSLFEFIRNNKLDANTYFANQAGIGLPPLHENIFGGTFGGPVFKNRTFFFFDYEGTRSSQLSTSLAGVPSTAEKGGDFGELCGGDGPNGPAPGATFDGNGLCSNPNGQLWDPFTGVYSASAGGPVRSGYIPYNNLATYTSPGNPKLNGTGGQVGAGVGNLMDPVALKLMSYYPTPNRFVGQSSYNPYINYVSAGATILNNNQWDLKIDQHFSDRDMLSARYSHRGTFLHSPYCYPNDEADPCTQGPEDSSAHLFALNYNHVFSATTVLSFTYGLTRTARFLQTIKGDYPNMDPVKDLGMPSYIDDSGTKAWPAIGIGADAGGPYLDPAGNSQSLGTGVWSYLKDGQDTHDLLVTLSHLQGRHELKFGSEFRFHQFNDGQPGTPAGYYGFDYIGTSQQPWSGGGDAMASFLIGTTPGDWGQYQMPVFLATQNFAWAGFAQDNFHASPKLTVNVGLRYDLTMPATERHNKMNWVDPNVASTLQAPAGYSAFKGGDEFASSSQPSDYNADYKNFGPRVGLAYSLNDKTVLRTGYGIYYAPSPVAADADVADVQGFSQTTTWQNTYQGDGATPWGRLSNPFPNGILYPTGSSLGLLTDVGFTAQGPVRTFNATPYEQSWSFEIQRALPSNMLADASYIGKKGTYLNFGASGLYNLNHLSDQVLSYSPTQIADMLTYVPNPYASTIGAVAPTSPLASSTVQAYELQLPYPQFQSFLVESPPWGNSIYHALQLRLQKRMSNGLQLLVTYVWSKSIDNASVPGNGSDFLGGGTSTVLDPNNLKLERSLSEFNIPQVFQFSYTYQLPFGRGQHFAANVNPIVNGFIGGWQTNGIWRFDDGQPIVPGLSGGQAMPTFGQRAQATGVLKRNHGSNWLNQYFANPTVVQIPAPYTLGNMSRTISLTNPGTANASLSAFKNFSLDAIREGAYMEFRLESFNTFNHPQFCGPSASVGSSTFGVVSCQANQPRQVQGALKVNF